MENSAKAIIIAGGMFILIMVITLLVIFGRSLSSYMQGQHDKEMVKQITEFNNKFANYQGTELRGNELISVLNRVIDYNALEAGEYGYDPVLVEIDLVDRNALDSVIKFNSTDENFLFKKNVRKIKNSKDSDDELKTISQKGTTILSKYSDKEKYPDNYIPKLTDTKLQKLSAEISNIAQKQDNSSWLDGYDRKEVYNSTRAKKLTNILGYQVSAEGKEKCKINVDGIEKDIIPAVKKATCEYYQYTQFKRIMFKCTLIEYSQDTGRINKMSFEVKTTTDGKIVTN